MVDWKGRVYVAPGEQVEDLERSDLKIIQSKDTFRFGIDGVLLAHFAPVGRGDRVLDLGTGNGIIPLLIAGRGEPELIHGLEIQSRLVDMARRSVELNRLQGLIHVFQGDICSPPEELLAGRYDVVVSNPPYLEAGGKLNPATEVAIARHELKCTLADVIKTGARMLRNRGRLALIHRPGRLVEILLLLEKEGVEPKRLRFVHPTRDRGPTMVLVEGVKGARPHLEVMAPLMVYDTTGEYTEEILEIYYG